MSRAHHQPEAARCPAAVGCTVAGGMPEDPARRRWLRSAAGAGVAAIAGTAAARPADTASFARALADEPMARPWRGVADGTRFAADAPRLLGRWPADLRGRFHRNGPAVFERAGQRYHHWFDGDGMVQQFVLDGGRVRHLGRLVETPKLRAERAAGRFLMPAFGTHVADGPPLAGPDGANTANTSVIEHGGRLLALWEGGSAFELDPQDLSTRGPVTWRADLAQAPFSAHPKVDAQGHLWNIGVARHTFVLWHVAPDGRLAGARVVPSPLPSALVHDIAVTARRLVVPVPPVQLDFGRPWGDGDRSEGPRPFPMVAGEPLRILVMDKDDPTRRRVFELPPQMVFHVGSAHDDGDTVVLSFVGSPDTGFLAQGAVAVMQGRPMDVSPSRLQVARLDLRTGRVRLDRLDAEGVTSEFPCTDPRRVGLPTRGLASPAAWRRGANPPGPFLHGLRWVDIASGREQRFDFGDGVIVEEHVVVPKPGRSAEREAWLLGTAWDGRRDATLLNLFDAAHVDDGPVAQAVLPYALPLGFHGNFRAA